MRINPQLSEKIHESLASVLPITAIVLLSIATCPAARALLESLENELRGTVPGRGIAFTVHLAALSV